MGAQAAYGSPQAVTNGKNLSVTSDRRRKQQKACAYLYQSGATRGLSRFAHSLAFLSSCSASAASFITLPLLRMSLMKRLIAFVSLTALISACGSSSSPTAPTAPTTPAVVTKIITVSGDLAFGNVNIGESATRTFTIGNSGNTVLTFTSLSAAGGSGTTGYTATPTSGTVAPGASATVTLRFSPTAAGFWSNVLTVVGDQTSGGAAINVSGVGVNNTPLFTIAGKGDNTFNIPASAAKVHVTGHFVNTGSNSNFIVSLNGRGFINEILRTADYDGVLLTPGGGVIAITSSGSIQWTFTEVR